MKIFLIHMHDKNSGIAGNSLIALIIGLAVSLLAGGFIAEGIGRASRSDAISRHNNALEQTRNAIRSRLNCDKTWTNRPVTCNTADTYINLWLGTNAPFAELATGVSTGGDFLGQKLRAYCVANSTQLEIEYVEKYKIIGGNHKAIGAEELNPTQTWRPLFKLRIACDPV